MTISGRGGSGAGRPACHERKALLSVYRRKFVEFITTCIGILGDLLHAAKRRAQRCRHMPPVEVGCAADEQAGVVEGARRPDVSALELRHEGDPGGGADGHQLLQAKAGKRM